MTFMDLAKARYSVRKFSDRPVEDELLRQVLEAGNIAPTGKNNQPQRVYVARSEEALAALRELTPCTFGAPTVLVFAYDTEAEWKNPLEEGIHSGPQDVSIVATHVMLAAAELGLGTCWVNYFANSKADSALHLPENEKILLLMPIGYPAADAAPAAAHNICGDLEKTVRYI